MGVRYESDFIDHCRRHITEHSVFDLSGRGVDKWDLYRNEIVQTDDVPLGSSGHVYGWYT